MVRLQVFSLLSEFHHIQRMREPGYMIMYLTGEYNSVLDIILNQRRRDNFDCDLHCN